MCICQSQPPNLSYSTLPPLATCHFSRSVSLFHVKVKVFVAQLCPTLCDPMDFSPPGSSVPGISQARILEWLAISFQGFPPWDLPNPEIKPPSPALQEDSLPPSHERSPGEQHGRFLMYHRSSTLYWGIDISCARKNL